MLLRRHQHRVWFSFIFVGLLLTLFLAPAAPTSFNIFGGNKDATAEKKDAPTGNDVPQTLNAKC